ncbi:MAG TPA: DUF4397 domain-containing protein [Steroidobacteraceae bacterium]|nr:DUF4397 domain-containing protein [Steroidobacteraceae bacterium]
MRKTTRLLTGLIPLLLAACYDNGGYGYFGYGQQPPPVGPQASVQFVHASPDAPPVNVLVDGFVAIPNLDYGQGTGEQQISAGTHTIEIQTLTPGSLTTVIGPTTMTLVENTDYVFAAEGPVASINAQIYSHALAIVGANSSQVQFVHAAPNAPSVSIYLTAPGADLASSTPFGTISFQGAVGPTQIASGQYEIRVTPAGTPATVLYDSGTILLDGGTDFVFSAMQNEGAGTATIFISAVDAFGDSQRLYDVATPVNVRVVNDSPNAPALAILANGNTATPFVSSLAYEAVAAYQSMTAGSDSVEITPASNTGDVLLNQPLEFDAGGNYSIFAVGSYSSLQTFVTRDFNRRYATQAKLRFLNGSPAAGLVDVYLTPPGTAIASVAPTYAGVAFLNDTGFVSYAAGTYDLSITPAGSQTPSIGPTSVSLSNSGVYTAVLRDAAGGGAPLGVIYLDDFNGSP